MVKIIVAVFFGLFASVLSCGMGCGLEMSSVPAGVAMSYYLIKG